MADRKLRMESKSGECPLQPSMATTTKKKGKERPSPMHVELADDPGAFIGGLGAHFGSSGCDGTE